jgi:hypothetical protein
VIAAAGAPAAQAVEIGIGDQSYQSLLDQRFLPLGIKTARIVLPWDIAQKDPWRLAVWMQTIEEHGMEPYVALGKASSDRCPGSPCVLPTDSQYRTAFDQLHALFPSIRLFTAWNEPNHAREPTATDPAAAAHYTDVIAEECPACTVVAGDLLDGPGMASYLSFYKAALTSTPAVWGLHNYYDTTYFQSTGTQTLLHMVAGPVWLSESGGIVTWRSSDGKVQLPYDERRAAASLSFGLQLAADHADRIQRMYVYQWRASPTDDFDAGVVGPDGSERPALAVLRTALGLPASFVPVGEELPPGPATIVAPPPRATARVALDRVRLGRRGVVHGRLRCYLGRCRGRLTLEGSGRIAERLVNGRAMRGTLRPRTRSFDLTSGTATTFGMGVPIGVIRRAGRRGLTLKVTVVPVVAGDFIPLRRAVRFPRSLQTAE